MSMVPAGAADSGTMSSSAILQELLSFQELGSVLYIAAHPDDEDTQLIAYLARGRGARTAYLSLTRGDGGQNLIGPELGEQLGLLRTQELLAARRVDGGRQFFTRARDFGFSKDYAETLAIWDRQQVLADTVRVIRTFQPDLLITAFSTEPGGTHGHHTASALMAVEAFKLAGDPKAFPEQLDRLKPWQPKRVLHGVRFRGNEAPAPGPQLEIGGYSSVLGESYGEISARSRSMHRTQGFGTLGSRGSNLRGFTVLAGDAATNDIFEGVPTDWSRFPGGAEIGRLTAAAIGRFDARDPSASVPALLEIRRHLTGLPAQALVDDKRSQLDHIIQACLGLYFDTTVESAEAVPGEVLKLTHTAIARGKMPVRWIGVRYPATGAKIDTGLDLPFNQPKTAAGSPTLPADTPLSQPYWLRKPGTTGMFTVDDPALIGRPENPPVFALEQVFEVGGQTLVLPDEAVQVIRDPAVGEIRHRLQAIAPVVLEFADTVELFAPGSSREIALELSAARPNLSGDVRLEAPAGWQVTPASQHFTLAKPQDHTKVSFKVKAPAQSATASFGALATIGGAKYSSRRIELRYPHLPDQLLQPAASFKALSLLLATRGRTVGYLPGAGDEVAQGIKRMGYAVTLLTSADLTAERLKTFDAIVIGVRAFNVRDDLPAQIPALMAYVDGGGTLIAQYNTQAGLVTDMQAALGVQISRDRVTDENAKITFLAPDHPALNTPNKIGPADFEHWVQERGLYFPDKWDGRFTPLLACNDPGEPSKSGALLVARQGKGHFVYASLVFFRELPEGVPGAYRLFANLVSLGQ